MIKNLSVVVTTHSSCSDIWPMFFGQIEQFFPNQKIYVFSDTLENLPNNCIPILYSNDDSYRTQYLKCIKQVNEKYCLTLNEDYILYDNVDIEGVNYCIDFLESNDDTSFVRLMKGIEYNEPKVKDKLFVMSNKNMWFFSQTSTIWKKVDLERVHEFSPESGMAFKVEGPQLEIVANETCKFLDLKGVFFYNGEKKRGSHHYDSTIFPHIASASVKGKWNLSEYHNELSPLLEKYQINKNIRGVY